MIWYGGDYNPEQWPEEIWVEDLTLMKRAGVNLVSLGIFSWSWLEPREGEFDFGWLDRVMDGLHKAGVQVDLATATAAPPPWLTHRYPEALPVTEDGVTLSVGSRQQYCPSSPVYRKLAARLVSKIVERYSNHPALAMWHINNEYGCHVSRCYCDISAEAFRNWLEKRYGTIDALNQAWGTAFWSQRYSDFAEIYPPRTAPTFRNPAQLLDFDRFSSDELLSLYRAEVAIVRQATPNIPITTNFMCFFKGVDYWSWASEVDIISNDSYPDPVDPDSPAYGAMSHDLMRSLRTGQPWLLMEQSSSAVTWRERNSSKPPGQMAAWSMQALARGADGLLFFQWRQSTSGAEKFLTGMIPHGGPETRVFGEIEALGSKLETLSDIAGSRLDAKVAIVFEWDSWWSIEQLAVPAKLSYVDGVFAWYKSLFERNVLVDFVKADADLTGYDAVIVPTLFSATKTALDNLAAFAESGGQLLVTYMSGITDETVRVTEGGYLGRLQSTLGIRVEEFTPLAAPDLKVRGGGTPPSVGLEGSIKGSAEIWSETVRVDDAEVISSFVGGFVADQPAITRRGSGWYCATMPNRETRGALIEQLLAAASVEFDEANPNIERVKRGSYTFEINHDTQVVEITPN
jgi:beta-galactosidase